MLIIGIISFLCLCIVFPEELETRLYYLPVTIATDTSHVAGHKLLK